MRPTSTSRPARLPSLFPRPRVPSQLRARAPPHRSIWLSHTAISTDPTLAAQRQTLLSPPPHSSLPSPAPAATARLLCVSKNTPPSTIAALLADAQATGVPTVGCVSELLPPATLDALGARQDGTEHADRYVVSVSSFYPVASSRGRAVVWRTGITGRAAVSVGREIPSGPRKDERGMDVSDAGFEAFMSGRKWGFGDQQVARAGGEAIAQLDQLDSSSVKQVVFFAADRTQPVLNALSPFTQSATVGLIGTSTPFHSPTHAPFSLFYNGELSSTGAVGVAIVDEAIAGSAEVAYAGTEVVGEPVEVTSAKGNIVLTLDSQNAARLLLNLVQALPSTIAAQGKTAAERSQHKETEFYAAVFDAKPELPIKLTRARHVSRIMAGDPSRGAMSVETEEDVAVGSYIVFLTHSSSPAPAPTPLPSDGGDVVVLHALAPSDCPPRSLAQATAAVQGAHGEGGPALEEVLVSGVFVAGSENGVVVGRGDGSGGSWVCGVEGAVVAVGR